MTRLQAAVEPRRAAEALEALKTAQIERARAALDTVSQKAKAARARARGHAVVRIDRGRSAAADRLEGIVDALRPDYAARSRRKAAAIAGGSSVALLAAIGLGVGLGMLWSKRLKQKEQVRERLAATDTSVHTSQIPDPSAPAIAPIVY